MIKARYLGTSGLTYSKFNSVIRILILYYCSHFEAALKGAGHVIGHFTGLDGALNARTHALLAEHADQVPATLRNLRDLGDRLHLFDATDAHFRNPECAANVSPLLPGLGCFHCSTFVGT